MNWRTVWAALLLGAACGPGGAAGHVVDVTIYDRALRTTLPVYCHEGRCYVEGRPGNEYEIRLRSRAGTEVLAVVSVDGVNAVTGETAHWSQTGYVLEPGQVARIRGWRKSTERVAAFHFTQPRHSYAARTGRPDHVGVIGVAVFHPRRPAPAPAPAADPWPDAEAPASLEDATVDAQAGASAETQGPSAAMRAQSARRERPLGTGHGRRITSRVTYTEFERASDEPAEIVTIHYETRARLVAMGVIRPPRPAGHVPLPFPGGGFVPDP